MNSINFKTISITDLAALINSKFSERGLKTFLVGGACVAIYSHNRYLSYDLDFVTFESKEKIRKTLTELGFESKGRYYAHRDCPYFIEFLSPPVAVGQEMVKEFGSLDSPFGQVVLLTPTDCVKDRLASFFHWKDMQALEQAIMVVNDQEVDLQEIELWAQGEKHLDKFNQFVDALKKSNPHNPHIKKE